MDENSDLYFKKYLKYKNLYASLKAQHNQLGGGDTNLIVAIEADKLKEVDDMINKHKSLLRENEKTRQGLRKDIDDKKKQISDLKNTLSELENKRKAGLGWMDKLKSKAGADEIANEAAQKKVKDEISTLEEKLKKIVDSDFFEKTFEAKYKSFMINLDDKTGIRNRSSTLEENLENKPKPNKMGLNEFCTNLLNAITTKDLISWESGETFHLVEVVNKFNTLLNPKLNSNANTELLVKMLNNTKDACKKLELKDYTLSKKDIVSEMADNIITLVRSKNCVNYISNINDTKLSQGTKDNIINYIKKTNDTKYEVVYIYSHDGIVGYQNLRK